MEIFKDYLFRIENAAYRTRTAEILQWVGDTFPMLSPRIAWNQPMFTDHGTYIIGFSVSKGHVVVSPERAGMLHFWGEIGAAGYDRGKMLFRIPWDSPVDYALLKKIIAFNIQDKADCATFWRR